MSTPTKTSFKSAVRQYGYRTPDGVDHHIDEATANAWGTLTVEDYVRMRAEATEGSVITRTVTTMITPWAVVPEPVAEEKTS